MNTELMQHIERQLLEIVGMLVMAQNGRDEEIATAKLQLVSMIHGLRIVINACEKYPMSVEEMEQEIERLKSQ